MSDRDPRPAQRSSRDHVQPRAPVHARWRGLVAGALVASLAWHSTAAARAQAPSPADQPAWSVGERAELELRSVALDRRRNAFIGVGVGGLVVMVAGLAVGFQGPLLADRTPAEARRSDRGFYVAMFSSVPISVGLIGAIVCGVRGARLSRRLARAPDARLLVGPGYATLQLTLRM